MLTEGHEEEGELGEFETHQLEKDEFLEQNLREWGDESIEMSHSILSFFVRNLESSQRSRKYSYMMTDNSSQLGKSDSKFDL